MIWNVRDGPRWHEGTATRPAHVGGLRCVLEASRGPSRSRLVCHMLALIASVHRPSGSVAAGARMSAKLDLRVNVHPLVLLSVVDHYTR